VTGVGAWFSLFIKNKDDGKVSIKSTILLE
jgi:hypothetical protein